MLCPFVFFPSHRLHDTGEQPAIDAFTLSLMRRFNTPHKSDVSASARSVQPLVYASYQAYLKR